MANTKLIEVGDKVAIPVAELEFINGGNTIWIHSPLGGTVLRIKCSGKITIESCDSNPNSHIDLMVEGNMNFCLSEDIII